MVDPILSLAGPDDERVLSRICILLAQATEQSLPPNPAQGLEVEYALGIILIGHLNGLSDELSNNDLPDIQVNGQPMTPDDAVQVLLGAVSSASVDMIALVAGFCDQVGRLYRNEAVGKPQGDPTISVSAQFFIASDMASRCHRALVGDMKAP